MCRTFSLQADAMKTLIFMLILASYTFAADAAVGVKVDDRDNFIRIEDAKPGVHQVVFISKASVLSASLTRFERTYEVQIVTHELMSNGDVAVSKTCSYSFFSPPEAERTIEQIIALSNSLSN
ncbi:MAG: hypothetical protein ACI9TH_001117 [Kiritimatiellia bacterium]